MREILEDLNSLTVCMNRIALAAIAGLSGGCSALLSIDELSLLGESCVSAADCAGESPVCEQSRCAVVCASDEDCPDSTRCSEQRCRATRATPFGGFCSLADDCQTALCDDGVCVSSCRDARDCPDRSVCVESFCQPVLRAGFVFDAIVSNSTSGFAHTHDVGRRQAEDRLPGLETFISEGHDVATVNDGIDSLLHNDLDALFVTSGLFFTQSSAKAAENPGTRFFTYSSPAAPNHVGYAARFHQAWFIAGFVAGTFDASVTRAGQIGFVAPRAIPQVIRELNAFARGVRRANPMARVEVVWANAFRPSDAVTKNLVDYLVTGGSRIIANRLGSRVVTDYIDTLVFPSAVFSIAVNDIDACAATPHSCLGAPYWNWGVLYTRLLRQIRNGTFDPTQSINDSIRPDPEDSAFHFALNDDRIPELRSIATDVANSIADVIGLGGEDTSLAGPYCVTRADQRSPPCVEEGELIADNELASMCWLIEGIVQRSDPEDPTSPLIDAFAPDGTVLWPPKIVDPTSISRPSCR